MNIQRSLFLIVVATITFLLAGCGEGSKTPSPPPAPSAAAEPDLAPFMAPLQRFSQKLGYSVQGKNAKLALFYLEELEETLKEVQEKVPKLNEHKIPYLVETIMNPQMKELESSLKKNDWTAAGPQYEQLIESCNRCHGATQHEFIKITSAAGTPPFNQLFAP